VKQRKKKLKQTSIRLTLISLNQFLTRDLAIKDVVNLLIQLLERQTTLHLKFLDKQVTMKQLTGGVLE
jgi:hypothetical protein